MRSMAKGLSKEQLLGMVEQAAAPVAASFGLQVWGLEMGASNRPVIRIFVDAIPGQDKAPEDQNGAAQEHLPEAAPEEIVDGVSHQLSGEGVTIGQCAEISRMVGLALDVEDVFPEAWVLEVSSPGLDRVFFRLDQLGPYVGRELDVTLWEPHPLFPARRKFKGLLSQVGEDGFTLQVELPASESADGGGTVDIAWDSVRKARLIHIFPDTTKPGHGGKTGGQGGGKHA